MANDTTIPVDDISEFPGSGTIQIDNEVMTYNGKSLSTPGAGSGSAAADSGLLLDVKRGENGSIPALHEARARVTLISACAGNCNGDTAVTVDEIVMMVNIALGDSGTPLLDCEAADANHDGEVTVDEIVTAVNDALNGCAE